MRARDARRCVARRVPAAEAARAALMRASLATARPLVASWTRATRERAPTTRMRRVDASASARASTKTTDDELYQFIVLRKDLGRALRWPLGALAAQCAHAAVSAVWTYADREDTREYCSKENMANMRKVVLEIKNESQLTALSEKLKGDGIEHALWREQPEDVVTCLATRPYRRSVVGGYFKKCNLAKDVFGAAKEGDSS